MTKELFKENVLDIISEGNIENYYRIDHKATLKSVINDNIVIIVDISLPELNHALVPYKLLSYIGKPESVKIAII